MNQNVRESSVWYKWGCRMMAWISMVICIGIMMMGITALAGTMHTITAPDNGHEYEVYQIFTGDETEGILSNVKWGENGSGECGAGVPDSILKEIEEASGTDAEKLAVIKKYARIKKEEAFKMISEERVLSVPSGYYLMKDKDGSQAGKNDAYTTWLVKVVGDVKMAPKADKPSSEKKVKDRNDTLGEESGWQDSADYDVEDLVPFQLTGKVASNYDSYLSYRFVFHDQQSEGLDFQVDTVRVFVDEKEITQGFSVQTSTEDGDAFEVVFENMKTIPEVKAGSTVTVEYKSRLTDQAVLGAEGNPNTMYLEYSNNPNQGQEGETGKTPEDTVIVFTYKIVVKKLDETEKALEGAEFILEKQLPDRDEGDENWQSFVAEKNTTGTVFTFRGLDDGAYRLTESITPAGYNTVPALYFTITADHQILSDSPILENLNGETATGEITFVIDKEEGFLETTVVNKHGVSLPETGGRGTFLFYAVGGVLIFASMGAGMMYLMKNSSRGGEDDEHKETMD